MAFSSGADALTIERQHACARSVGTDDTTCARSVGTDDTSRCRPGGLLAGGHAGAGGSAQLQDPPAG